MSYLKEYLRRQLPSDGVFEPLPVIKCASLRDQLRRLLTSTDRRGWDTGFKSGRFDVRRSPRAMAGVDSVFKRRWEDEGIDSVVSILVDGSGSMACGDRLTNAAALCLMLADTCDKSGVPCSVNLFYDGHSGSETARDRIGSERTKDGQSLYPTTKKDRVKMGLTGQSWQDATLISFKGFDVRTNPRKIQAMQYLANGGTPDYPALFGTLQDIALRPERRKIVIVLSDGIGDAPSVRKACEVAASMGIDVIGFGIGARCISNVYPNGIDVPRANEIDEVALKKVVKIIGDTESARRVF
jgi:Mg-chelatase subunit ChlD